MAFDQYSGPGQWRVMCSGQALAKEGVGPASALEAAALAEPARRSAVTPSAVFSAFLRNNLRSICSVMPVAILSCLDNLILCAQCKLRHARRTVCVETVDLPEGR
jgi:hypothetical protein